MDTSPYSSNMDVRGMSSRPVLDPVAFIHGTARVGGDQSISNQSELFNSDGSFSNDTQPPQVTQEQFADIVIKADSKIPRSKLKDVKYLCHDKVRDQHVLEQAKSTKDIFQDMNVSGTLTPKNIILISELFHRLGMLRDKSNLFKGTNVEWKPGMPSTLDEFRCLMYSIAEQIPSSDFKKMKDFCLDQEMLEPYQLEDCENFLDFFSLLEDEAVIEASNIGLLKDFTKLLKIKKVKDLVDKYEEQMMMQKQPVLALTIDDSKRLMTYRTFTLNEDLSSVDGWIGFKEYQKLLQMWQKEKEKKLSGTGETTSPRKSRSPAKMSSALVTPSMLTGDGEANLKEKRKFDIPPLGDKSIPGSLKAQDVKPSKDGDVPELRSLKSRDIEGANYDDEEEDYEKESMEVDNDNYTTSPQTLHVHRLPFYPMDKNPKGICLIISNRHFDDVKQERPGTEKDVQNLRRTFGNKLNFEVHVREDLTAAEMQKELKKWRDHDHKDYNAFICCLLSHGNRGVVMGTDSKPLQLSHAMGYFKGNCPSLINKPKIFIVQACQGNDWQGFTNQQVPKSPTGESIGIGSVHTPQLPNESDFVLLLATVPGFKSARNNKKGSWFIMALTKIFQKYGDIEINSAMTVLNNQLSKVIDAKMDGKYVSQTAFPSHTLRKLLFFQQPDDCQPRVP